MLVEVIKNKYVNPAHVICVDKIVNRDALHQVDIILSAIDNKGKNKVISIVFDLGSKADDLVRKLSA